MLAEPKRKTVWSLNPRGKYWSEDKSKIGQKLLESMGWIEGHGLGKNNSGIKDNIKVCVNFDNKGLGYKPSADDVWVHKNEDYEQLLANLAVHHNNTSSKHEMKVSNLEETSKKLRNRLHYNKLIKAKNLSQCSEKDLISIFPKKRQNIENQIKSGPQLTQINSSDKTFDSTTNINDYFKSKMAKLKLKSKFNKTDSTNIEENYSITNQTNEQDKCKSQESDESHGHLLIDSDMESTKKQKKSKKKSDDKKKCQNLDSVDNDSNSHLESTEPIIVKKENRKKKHKSNRVLDSQQIEEIDSQTSSDSSKKSNKKLKLNIEKYETIVPKGYNPNNLSVTESVRNYHKICAAIGKDKALSTTNLMAVKGYGCHPH